MPLRYWIVSLAALPVVGIAFVHKSDKYVLDENHEGVAAVSRADALAEADHKAKNLDVALKAYSKALELETTKLRSLSYDLATAAQSFEMSNSSQDDTASVEDLERRLILALGAKQRATLSVQSAQETYEVTRNEVVETMSENSEYVTQLHAEKTCDLQCERFIADLQQANAIMGSSQSLAKVQDSHMQLLMTDFKNSNALIDQQHSLLRKKIPSLDSTIATAKLPSAKSTKEIDFKTRNVPSLWPEEAGQFAPNTRENLGQTVRVRKIRSPASNSPILLSLGVTGPDGITGPHSNLFRKVRSRYHRVQSTFIQ